MAREQAEALHGEIERLPAAFRLPVVLCYLEGLTVHEAARRLRWLARHGPQPHGPGAREAPPRRSRAAASCCPVPRSPRCSTPGPPRRRSHPSCATSTTRAAIHFAAGPAAGEALSASTAALAQEVLRSMLIHKLKLVALTVLFLGAVATGAGFLSHSPAMKDEPSRIPAGPPPTPVAAKPDDAAPGRMMVVGRVLDPAGKPMAGRAGRRRRAAAPCPGCPPG